MILHFGAEKRAFVEQNQSFNCANLISN